MLDINVFLQQFPMLVLLLTFVVGASIGSFLNVVVHRLPIMLQTAWERECQQSQGEDIQDTPHFSLLYPHSHCTKCKTPIKPWHNLPIIGWLMIKGRCAACHAPISARYPLVELMTALLTVYITFTIPDFKLVILYTLITWWLICLVLIDADTFLLPDQLTLSLLWLVLIASALGVGIEPIPAIMGAAAGYLSLWSVFWIFKLVTGKDGMGYGDFKLFAALGAIVGANQLLIVILLASVVGVIVGVAQLKLKPENGAMLPFGPFLGIAGWIVMLWGEIISDVYWQWVLHA